MNISFKKLNTIPKKLIKLRNLKANEGFVLIFSVIISSILLSVGLAMFSIALKELILSSSGRESQFAFYAADSASECAVYWDIRHPGYAMSIFGSTEDTLSSGLVGYWNFDDGTGSDSLSDSSVYNNIGTLTNMDSATDWVSGKVGGALSFDGTDDYVSFNSDSGLDIVGSVSISAWFKKSISGGDMKLVSKQKAGGGGGGYKLSIFADTVEFEIRDEDDVSYLNRGAPGAITINKDQWYHVVGIYSDAGDYIKTYVNGTLDRNVSVDGVLSQSDGLLRIGKERQPNPWGYFNGEIDEVRIYNRVLSEQEISMLYQLTSPGDSYSPIPQNSNVLCNNEDITNPTTGWDTGGGWDVSNLSEDTATTVFDMNFENGSCATITVIKDTGSTRIDSRGYNTCDLNYPRRVERGLRVSY